MPITQHDWDAAMQSDRVREGARSALAFLKKHRPSETQQRGTEIEWALREVCADTAFFSSEAEFYAAFVLVLNPWMLEIPTEAEKKRNYRLDLMRAWEKSCERYLIALLNRYGGKARLTFEDLSIDGVQLCTNVRLDGSRAEIWIKRPGEETAP